MPHTNRKKKNAAAAPQKKVIVHTKRKEVLDEEGWTHVIDKPQPKQTDEKTEAPELWAIAADFKIGNAYYVDRTLEEYEIEYSRARKAWGRSEACRQLKVILEGKTGEEKSVDNVVCFGLGSFQNARGEGRKASFMQLVALEEFIEGLGIEEKISLIFQDPAFTELDVEFLTNLEYEILSDPEAFDQITTSTLVYGIHCYADIYEKVAKQGGAKLLVCTDVEKFGGPSSGISDSTVKTLEVMVDGYEKMEFPQIRSDFSDTKIYWRRSGDAPPGIEESGILVEAEPEAVPEESSEEVQEVAEVAEELQSEPINEAKIIETESAPEESKDQDSQPTEEPKAESVKVVQARTESIREAVETGISEETKSTEDQTPIKKEGWMTWWGLWSFFA